MATPDPKLDLRDFLRSALVSGDTSVSFSPADDVVVANYDVGPAYPEVAVVAADWITLGGGETGATAMDPTGGGAYQHGYYSVLVDCWGGPRGEYDSVDIAADTVAEELGQAVARETRAGAAGAPSGYEYIFSDPPSDANDTQEAPTEYRRQVTVRLSYRYEP